MSSKPDVSCDGLRVVITMDCSEASWIAAALRDTAKVWKGADFVARDKVPMLERLAAELVAAATIVLTVETNK